MYVNIPVWWMLWDGTWHVLQNPWPAVNTTFLQDVLVPRDAFRPQGVLVNMKYPLHRISLHELNLVNSKLAASIFTIFTQHKNIKLKHIEHQKQKFYNCESSANLPGPMSFRRATSPPQAVLQWRGEKWHWLQESLGQPHVKPHPVVSKHAW